MTRRTALATLSAPLLPGAPGAGGLCLNEDNSHYFATRAGRRLTAEDVRGWVDQYAGTQVRELMLCPNSMRTSYASKVWDAIWHGYDPAGPDDQPLLASTAAESRAGARKWIHTAWQLHQDGIDVYDLWIRRAREKRISPWISVRMNDVHNVNDERSFIHGEYWRAHPELRRVGYRFSEWNDRAFDYGREEVREHHFRLIRELCERYDFEGLELDWMRFGHHFRPGHEESGREILSEFTARVRRELDAWQRRRGHRIRLAARVPSRPQAAFNLGYDPVLWARKKLVDLLVVTPFFATAETDMPIALWKRMLEGTGVLLGAGLELLLRPYPEFKPLQTNSIETVRGMAAAYLESGADRIYLFNYMDSETAMANAADYPKALHEAGSLATLRGQPRRHVVTYADTWAPGEARGMALPVACRAGRWLAFRLATGPKPEPCRGEARLALEGAGCAVRVNGELCAAKGPVEVSRPRPEGAMSGFEIPAAAVRRGVNVVEILPAGGGRVTWVEIAFS